MSQLRRGDHADRYRVNVATMAWLYMRFGTVGVIHCGAFPLRSWMCRILVGTVAMLVCGCTPERFASRESEQTLYACVLDGEVWALEEKTTWKLMHPCEPGNADTVETGWQLIAYKTHGPGGDLTPVWNMPLEKAACRLVEGRNGDETYLITYSYEPASIVRLDLRHGRLLNDITPPSFREQSRTANGRGTMTKSGKLLTAGHGIMHIHDLVNRSEWMVDAFSNHTHPLCAVELGDGSIIAAIYSENIGERIKRIDRSGRVSDLYYPSQSTSVIGLARIGDTVYTLSVRTPPYPKTGTEFLLYEGAGRLVGSLTMDSQRLTALSLRSDSVPMEGNALSFLVHGDSFGGIGCGLSHF